MRSYIASSNIYAYEPSFMQLPCAAVGTSLSIGFQTAYSISEHNISTSRKQRIPRVPRYRRKRWKTCTDACVYAWNTEYYFPKYIYLSMSITDQISALHYQISPWFFHAFASAEIPRAYLLF